MWGFELGKYIKLTKMLLFAKSAPDFLCGLSTIAPDQEDEVFEALLSSSGYDIQEKTCDDVKENALEAYNQSESYHTRLQILSTFSRHFSKTGTPGDDSRS